MFWKREVKIKYDDSTKAQIKEYLRKLTYEFFTNDERTGISWDAFGRLYNTTPPREEIIRAVIKDLTDTYEDKIAKDIYKVIANVIKNEEFIDKIIERINNKQLEK